MIENNEVLLKYNNEWRHYSKPHEIISVTTVGDVLEALQAVECLVNQKNWHAAGFISYEAAPAFDKALHVIHSEGFPLLWFGLYENPLVIDLPRLNKAVAKITWRASTSQINYLSAIEKIKDQIACGNTYQVNYTMRLISEFGIDPWDFFLHLAQNQNKYAGYINTTEYAICSASPELFFKLDGDKIYSRPMKGTVNRGRTTVEDKELVKWLENSQKNQAENVMIVDMIRNDLGRIAEIGTVQVPELFNVEKYPTLFQMTSSVQAKTISSITKIFTALFPCASITGAPKVSTMKIIAELETTSRRIYTGTIGYISPNRKAQFNVAIRTAIINRKTKTAEYGVGGGVVWDSTSTGEFEEAMLKASILTEQTQIFSLIETILWTQKDGYFLLNKHMDRMADSAEYFGYPFSSVMFSEILEESNKRYSAPQRIRVLLDPSGKFLVEFEDLAPSNKTFNVKLADESINSINKLYFHKTTHRQIYPSLEKFDDILLYNERDELTEFTIGNLVVDMDGKMFTPPISCGLLAGTFRAYLLETGKIKERVIHKDELLKCSKLYLVNSVRKWVNTKLI